MADSNDWSDLIAPSDAATAPRRNKQDDWSDLIAPRTLGAGTPTVEVIEENRARSRASQAAAQRFNNLSASRRSNAVARNFAAGIPIAGSLVNTNTQDVNDYRTGFPVDARVSETAGRTIPYVGIGAGLPSFMSTMPRAMMTSGAIEAGDSAARENLLHLEAPKVHL
jgi:hypothetical protein